MGFRNPDVTEAVHELWVSVRCNMAPYRMASRKLGIGARTT